MPARALKGSAWPRLLRGPTGLCRHISTTTSFRQHFDVHASVTPHPCRVTIPPPHSLRELTLGEWKQYQHSHEISPHAMGRIHSTDSFTTVDGPGIRYMIFLQGCAMRCLFCCNPDSLSYSGGSPVIVSALVKAIARVAPYLRPNEGGVTVSGGEPMLQPTFVASLFDEVHGLGLTTCLDTNGQGTKAHHWDVVLPRTDYVLFCIKHMDPRKYEALTHMKQGPALRFAKELAARQTPFFLRYVYVPGLTDAPDDIDRLIDFAAAQPSLVAIDLLPYHLLGKQKWATLGKTYPLEKVPLPSKEKVLETVKRMEAAGLKVMCNIGEPTLPRWSGRHAN